jgi:hypothetical protein
MQEGHLAGKHKGFFWPRTTYASDDEVAAVAEKIRAALVARARHLER